MKSRYLKVSLSSLLFLFLVTGTIALINPVYQKTQQILRKEASEITEDIALKTGLIIKYDSLSPSVLAGINLRGIEVRDAESDKKLVQIKKATFSYRFLDFFSKEPAKAIKLLLLQGVTIEFDSVKDGDIIEKINENFLSENKKTEGNSKSRILPLLNGRQLDIPFDVELKNLSIHYATEKNDFLVSIKNILLEKSFNVRNGVVIKTSGRLEFRSDYLKSNDYRSLCACGFSVSGTLYKNLNGSSLLLKLFENSRADYSLSKAELLSNYSDNRITVRSINNSLPYTFHCEADLEKSSVSLGASANRLDPGRLLRVHNSHSFLKKIFGSTVTGDIKVGASFAEDTDFVDSINLSTDAEISLSKKIMGQKVNVNYNLKGQNGIVKINRFNVSGEPVSASYEGSFDIKNMQPSGVFSLDHLLLNNGGLVQTEVYIEPYKNGFMCFAPQLFMDERSLTALQLSVLPVNQSVDFVFEFDDYSHADYEKSGHVKIDGSYMTGKNSLIQASASISNIFVDSLMQTVLFFSKDGLKDSDKKSFKTFEDFILTDEIYFTTDFETYSFNSPFFLVASTENQRQLLMLSIDGSNQTINLSNMELQFNDNTAHATGGIDFNGSFTDFNFFLDVVANTLPYTFSGSYSNKFLLVSGDYDFNAAFNFEDKVQGSVDFTSLPVKAGENIFAASVASTMYYKSADDFEIEVSNFDVEEPSGKIAFKPHFVFSGSGNKYGFVFSKIGYFDVASALDGKGNLIWGLTDGTLDSLLVDVKLKSLISSERVDLNASIQNPQLLPLSVENLMNDFYISAQGTLKNFCSGHFLTEQNKDNVINADFSATGTVKNPLVNLKLNKSSINAAGFPLTAFGNFVYDDRGLSVTDSQIKWAFLNVENIAGGFKPEECTGFLTAKVSGELCKLTFNVPLQVNLMSLTPGNNSFSNLMAQIKSDKMSGTFFPGNEKLDFVVTKNDSLINVVSAGGKGIRASIHGSSFEASSGVDSPLKFDLKGSVINNQLDIQIKNINADLRKFCQTIGIPYVNFTQGTLNGALRISGLTTDPEFTGAVQVIKPEFTVPFLSKKTFRTEKVFATAGQKNFQVKPTKFLLDKNPVSVGLNIEFDRWGIDFLDCDILTDKDVYIPMDMTFPFIRYKGNAGFDMLIHLIPDSVTITGDIFGNKGAIEIQTNDIVGSDDDEENSDDMDFIVDLNIQIHNKVQILLNPLLRGLIVPGSAMELFIDTRTGGVGAKGEVNLRGGEVVWLNRNFYMKEGRMVFNETQDRFDPRITVRAETRERDVNNNQVTIILSATGQTLSQFNPRLSASPAKSEKEIVELLGQVITADSENAASLAVAGGDYIVQATVMRQVENALREVFNFDIFSIRTNVLQNAVKQGMEKSANRQPGFGNYFDNSAVYVGKYFGSAMYVDALMHWNYDDTKAGDKNSNGLVFQPEFGLEMESPYVNIRLGVAPDLEALKKSFWTTSPSITLSWKHSF